MKATEINVEQLYAGDVVYVTPSFQRPYDQSGVLVENLLSVLLSPAEEPHFMGALVTRELPPTWQGYKKALLIDGNQRLMTLVLLMLAVRDTLARYAPEEARAFNGLCFMNGDARQGEGELKNMVAPRDRAAFEALVLGTTEPYVHRPLVDDYRHGLDAIRGRGVEDLRRFADRLLHDFTFVELALGREEDPYPVFKLCNPQDSDFTRSGLDTYTQFSRDPELMDLVAGGESQEVEFKARTIVPKALRGKQNIQGVGTVVRAVAAFMNSRNGGVLLIGVEDDGRILGIESEYADIDHGKPNWDGYQLYLQNTLRAKLDCANPFLYYELERHTVSGHDVCLVRISPSEVPVYIEKRLYVRTGAQTVEMLGPDLVAYVRERFP